MATTKGKIDGSNDVADSSIKKETPIPETEADILSNKKEFLSKECVKTTKNPPEPNAAATENLTSVGDTDPKKPSPTSSLPSADEISDGDFSSLSTTSSSDEKNSVEKDPKDISKVSSSNHSSEQTTSADHPSFNMGSYLYDYAFSDSDDSSGINIDLYQAILESLRDLQKKKDVDISKAVSGRQNRRRLIKSAPGGTNSANCVRIQQDSSSSTSCPQTPLPSSESSQDAAENLKPIGPTEFSHALISKAKLDKIEATSTAENGENTKTGPDVEMLSIERSSGEKSSSDNLGILKYDVANALKQSIEKTEMSSSKKSSSDSLGILKYDVSSALKKSSDSTASTKKTPDSQPPLSKSQRRRDSVKCPVPMQTPADLIIADRLTNDPHARRINSLTSLIDRLVDFANYMDRNPLLSVEVPESPRIFQGRDPVAGSSRDPTLRELEEKFRQGFLALQDDSSDSDSLEDEEDETSTFRQSVRIMRNHLRLVAHVISLTSDSEQEETVSPSDEPVSIEEISRLLPILWKIMEHNNTFMHQWTTTLLDWSLHPTPESRPQQFYDAEIAVRALFGRIDDVRRSTARLMGRWRSRRMDYGELGDLTYLMTMASTAMSMYSILESEVINIRYVMGTRLSAGNRRRPRESSETDSDESVQCKKGKKE